jgi:hypothetical protein
MRGKSHARLRLSSGDGSLNRAMRAARKSD